MRVNVYAEEITQRVEIVTKQVGAEIFTGVRFCLELPAVHGQTRVRGPFVQSDGDDDSAAVTFWAGEKDVTYLRAALLKGVALVTESLRSLKEVDDGLKR